MVIYRHSNRAFGSHGPGQISVPAEVRRKLGIGPGSVLEWDEQGEETVVRRATRHSFEDIHQALFPKAPAARSVAKMREGVRRHVRKRYARLDLETMGKRSTHPDHPERDLDRNSAKRDSGSLKRGGSVREG